MQFIIKIIIIKSKFKVVVFTIIKINNYNNKNMNII